MNALSHFDWENHQVRVVVDDHGRPWFNAQDVCEALTFANPRKALADHVDEEDVGKCDTLTDGGIQAVNHVNASGLYALVFGSTKPEAKRFKKWVTAEVLPSIHTQGYYLSQDATPAQIAQLQADLSSAQHKLELHKEMAQEATLDARALQIKAAALEEAVDEFFAYSELQERTAHAIRMNWGEVLAKLTQDIRHARGKVNRLLQEAGVPDLQDREIAGCGKAA